MILPWDHAQASGGRNDAAFVHWSGNSGRDWPGAFQFAGRPSRRPLDRSRELPRHPALHRQYRRHVRQRNRLDAVSRRSQAVRGEGAGFAEFRRTQAARGGRHHRAEQAADGLQAELERLMQRIGLDPEGRKFIPHVTLARLHDATDRDVADYLSLRGYFPSKAFTAERFVLFSSRASTGGGPYVVEDAYELCE